MTRKAGKECLVTVRKSLRVVEGPNFTFWRGRKEKKTTFFFFSWTSLQSLRIQLQKKNQHLTNWKRWKKRGKVWSSANSLFKWRFSSRSRRHCLSALLISSLMRKRTGARKSTILAKDCHLTTIVTPAIPVFSSDDFRNWQALWPFESLCSSKLHGLPWKNKKRLASLSNLSSVGPLISIRPNMYNYDPRSANSKMKVILSFFNDY